MSIIFPGNYVARLNAYRDQGVQALPGVNFYKQVGAVVLSPDTRGIGNNETGFLSAGTYDPLVLSPDLRQDDKPRKDKPFVVPAGAVVYRTAISAPGIYAGAAGKTIVIDTLGANAPATGTLTSDALGYFPKDGVSSVLNTIVDGTAVNVGADVLVKITTDGNFIAKQMPSQGADRDSPAAILVELCWYMAAPAPDADDANIPFAVEAGEGY